MAGGLWGVDAPGVLLQAVVEFEERVVYGFSGEGRSLIVVVAAVVVIVRGIVVAREPGAGWSEGL